MVRIGIPQIGGAQWLGGWHYMVNLASALAAGAGDDVETVLFLSSDAPDERVAELAALPRTRVVRNSCFDARGKRRRLAQALVAGVDTAALEAFRAHGVDVVLENAAFFGRRFPIPAVAWIPDFQHARLPHLFSRIDRLRRSIGFGAQVGAGRLIMLSSRAAQADCLEFYPRAAGRIEVVPFAVSPAPPLAYPAARARVGQLGLPTRFALVCNQFWVHKNHGLLIDAAEEVRAKGGRVPIAMTGRNGDPRDPGYFDGLRATVAARKLDDFVRFLGPVPYDDISALMRCAAALVNPSRFEGWNTAVEEAKVIGLPLILSDIPVHREQAPNATFLDPDDAAGLASRLLELERQEDGAAYRDLPAARQEAATRHAEFGERLARVFRRGAGLEPPMPSLGRPPTFSIVTVCLNAERTIGQTLESVASQTWSHIEHIVVDGCSTDRTAAVVAEANHPGLRFVRAQDEGIYDAMNKGLAMATGDYTLFLNADDFLADPDVIHKVADCAAISETDCILGDTIYVNEDGNRTGRLYSTAGFRPAWLRFGIQPPHPSFFAKTEVLREIGGFDTRFRVGADFDLIARLFLKHKKSFARVPGVLACFRTGGLTTSSLRVKRQIGREVAESLRCLGQPLPVASVMLRYPMKMVQFAKGSFMRRTYRLD